MIPIKLEFEAFGPFPKRQIIEFDKFDHDRIFLISGHTGSGKTTIFDAITFSLYGQSSGFTRQADTFKSDFADDKTVCYVAFEFIIKGKYYIVRREPIQFKLKRNNNLTKENSTAELILEDGNIISGTANVDKHLEELLGMNADQFKKIVMLPQGEFRRFLSDDGNEKQKILRKIFGTKILDDFTEKLREASNQIKNEAEHCHTQCMTYISSISSISECELSTQCIKDNKDITHILTLLKESNFVDKSILLQNKKEAENLENKKQDININYYKETNEKFILLENTQNELKLLEADKHVFTEIEKEIVLLNSVKDIIPTFNEIKSFKKQIEETISLKAKYENNIEQNKQRLIIFRADFEKARKEKDLIPQTVRQIEGLNRQKDILGQIKALEQNNIKAKEIIANTKANLFALTQFRDYILLSNETSELKNDIVKLKDILSEIEKYSIISEEYLLRKQAYTNAFNSFINGQAFILAQTLEDEKPCPVCGSLDHPNPSQNSLEQMSQEQLDKSKSAYEKITKQVENAMAVCRQQIAMQKFENADDKMKIKEYLPLINERISFFKQNLFLLKDKKQAMTIREDLSSISPLPQVVSVEKKITELDKSIAANEEKLTIIITSIEELVNGLTDKDMDEQGIAILIEQKTLQMEKINQNFEKLEAELSTLNSANERNIEAVNQNKDLLNKLNMSLHISQKQFDTALDTANISYEMFIEKIVYTKRLEEYQQKISEYKQNIAVKTSFIDRMRSELLGKSIVNISALQIVYDEIAEKLDTVNDIIIKLSSKLTSNKDVYVKLTVAHKKYNELNLKYAQINKLFEVANGKYSDRMNFERYVLASYFNDVIESANLRLEQMTSSRYTLIRRTEREKGNKASGLSLDVFDTYTGKSRHVNTLSGGESFKIALSLALGLADIISRDSGGIELNTIFIDEGFGSLDSNSLDNAVECLYNLRSNGRYIGIISHIGELKEKISAKINVVQQPNGSYIDRLE